jgi:hypothetical protein
MNSLQQLNTLGTTTIDVTDNRFSKVIFDRVAPLQPLAQVLEITSTTVTVDPGIEIVEIINYATANVRYRVTIQTGGSPLLTGSSVTWGAIPTSLLLTTAGNVNTISDITTVADWDAVKSFTWNLPATFATNPNWYLDVAVIYYDSELGQDVTVNWEVYDEDFYYIAELFAVASMSSVVGVRKQFSAALTSQSNFDFPGSRIKQFNIAMSSVASILISGLDLDLGQAVLSTTTSLSVIIGVRKTFTVARSASATMSVTPTYTFIVTNLTARSYLANTGNAVFTSPNTPNIPDTDTSATFSIELTSTLGEFGTATGSQATFTYSVVGAANINSYFSSIYFWPNKGQSGNGTFTYKQYKNSVLQTTRSVVLANVGDFGVPTQLYTYSTVGTFTFQPIYRQQKYSVMDYLVVGGGAAGSGFGSSQSGGGGGGGGVTSYTNQNILVSSYNIIVGQGGAQNGGGGGVGGAGGASRFGTSQSPAFDHDVAGGTAGGVSEDSVGGNNGVIGTAGPVLFFGGADDQGALQGGLTSVGGGGGGGASANGQNGSVVAATVTRDGVPFTGYVGTGGNGGAGVVNSISGSSQTYGSGGGGGARHNDLGAFDSNSKPATARRGTNGAGTYGRGGIGGETYSIRPGVTVVQNNAQAGIQGIVIVKLHL